MRSHSLSVSLVLALFTIGCHYHEGCEPFDDGYDGRDYCERTGLCRDGGPPTDVGARPFCALDADCAVGRICDGGLCVPSAPCTDDRDCETGLVCDERDTCALPTPGCTSSDDCGEAEVCVEASCRPEGDVCRTDVDCGPGRGCVDNACRPLCTSDADCDGDVCIAIHCVPSPECTASADCDAGEICVGDRCTTGCASTADCGTEEVCELGVCRPDVAPRPFCESDDDCAAGHPCVGGVCRTVCPSGEDEECRRADVQFIDCAPVEALNLCFTRTETSPECVTAAECPVGERCIDASCR